MNQSDRPRPQRPSDSASLAPSAQGSGEAGASTQAASGDHDVVLIHGPTEDLKGLRVLRARDQTLEVGEMRPVQEGKPLSGEIVKLRPRAGSPRICDVETQLSREELDRARGVAAPSLGHAGPARVTSDAYRSNWDAIYRSPGSNGSGELN